VSPDNPAINYLASAAGNTSAEKLLLQYADYLLSVIPNADFPVDLNTIAKHFNLKVYKVPLAGQRALSTPNLNIFLEQDDRETVQRYSMAHEMMEFLFHAIDEMHPGFPPELLSQLANRKEALCELGASNLLMPMQPFRAAVQKLGFSINTGKCLASECRVSLTASLRRMLDTRIKKAVLAYFKFSNSTGEFIPSAVKQSNMFGPLEYMDPPKKLRILRIFNSSYSEVGFIPKQKSVESNTSIFKCFESGGYTSGFDYLDLVSEKGTFFVESIPVSLNGEKRVLSLIFLD
jgi:Zn-dependent peptidase ImmA (M78 family)